MYSFFDFEKLKNWRKTSHYARKSHKKILAGRAAVISVL
jgi:hypothetical protein